MPFRKGRTGQRRVGFHEYRGVRRRAVVWRVWRLRSKQGRSYWIESDTWHRLNWPNFAGIRQTHRTQMSDFIHYRPDPSCGAYPELPQQAQAVGHRDVACTNEPHAVRNLDDGRRGSSSNSVAGRRSRTHRSPGPFCRGRFPQHRIFLRTPASSVGSNVHIFAGPPGATRTGRPAQAWQTRGDGYV